jgi:hypothetical protein
VQSAPGTIGPVRPRSLSFATRRRSGRTLVKSGIPAYIDARHGSRPSAGIRPLRVHCGYTGGIANSSPMPFVNSIKSARERIVARRDDKRTDFLRKRGFDVNLT